MNIIRFFILTVLSILITVFSLFSQSKLSPNAKMLIKQINSFQSNKTNFLLNNDYCSGLIKVNNDDVENDLKLLNVIIGTKAKNIWTVRIPITNLEEVSRLSGITYFQLDEPVINFLDQARKATKVDSVQIGVGLDQTGYTGKNIIVGVVDNGFDYTHPVFYDTDQKKLKIVRLWNQKLTGTPPSGFSYGTEFISESQILDLKKDEEGMSHGTHVAGIAAGNGNGSAGLYKGIAPDVDIVLVSRVPSMVDAAISTGFSNLIDGINYVFKYAESVNKPAVVNLSLGNLTGPHDGTSLFSEACNNLSGKGKIIVFAAGNSNMTNAHFDYYFPPFDTITEFKTFIGLSKGQEQIWVDCWGEKDNPFSMSISLFDSANSKVTSQTKFYQIISDINEQISITGSDDSLCIINIVTTTAEYNGKPRIFLNIGNKSKDKILLTGSASGGSINMWNSYIDGYSGYNVAFSSLNFPWALSGNNKITISDFASSDSVVSVGAYISKTFWLNLNGQQWGYSGLKVGNIAPFSSLGPTIDKRMKPEVTAPGMALISSVNSYDASYYSGGANFNSSSKKYSSGGRDYLFSAMSGTSMAAPVVTGIIALMLEKRHDLSPSEIKYIFKRTAIVDNFVNDTTAWGYGKVNAYQCMRFLENKIDVQETSNSNPESFIVYPNPCNGNFTLKIQNQKQTVYHIEIFDILGNKVNQVSMDNTQDLRFNLQFLPKGTYTLKIIEGKNINIQKIIFY